MAHRTQTSTCIGKRDYATWAKAARSARYTNHHYDETFEPYRCPYCNRYHIGHYARRNPRRPRDD